MKYVKNMILVALLSIFSIFMEVISCFVLLENSSGKRRFA